MLFYSVYGPGPVLQPLDPGGWYTSSFTAYHFAIKARLNLLLVKAVVRRAGKSVGTTSPKCKNQPESLGHVLNVCTPNAGLMRDRHGKILDRLVKVIPKEDVDIFMEQRISLDDLRPYIVLHNPHHWQSCDMRCHYIL